MWTGKPCRYLPQKSGLRPRSFRCLPPKRPVVDIRLTACRQPPGDQAILCVSRQHGPRDKGVLHAAAPSKRQRNQEQEPGTGARRVGLACRVLPAGSTSEGPQTLALSGLQHSVVRVAGAGLAMAECLKK